MAATQQPPSATTPSSGAAEPSGAAVPSGPTCAVCGAPLAADQRYCLSCGTRRGEPRVPLDAPPQSATAAAPTPSRPADVSPLAAVIGIALLGGMLLIGVLIGRGANDDPPPAPVVEIAEPGAATTPSGESTGGEIASEWPQGTDGFTIQITTVSKEGATPESVDAAQEQAVSDGAIDAAVLDSDLYSSLPPGNYVIYSGVYTERQSAEVALKGLRTSLPTAAVVEVADSSAAEGDSPVPPEGLELPSEPPATDGASSEDAGTTQPPEETGASDRSTSGAITPEAGGESEAAAGDESR